MDATAHRNATPAAQHTDNDFARLIGPVARELLGPENKRLSSPSELRFGTNGSVSVMIRGEKAGTWYDHEAGTGGGVLALVTARKGLVNGDAIEWLRGFGLPDRRKPAVPTVSREASPVRVGRRNEPQVPPGFREVASYDYTDLDGTLLFQAVRFESDKPDEPKTFRQGRPYGKDGWIWNLDGVERVPYRLPELLGTPLDELVFIAEGEKDVDNLRDEGLFATTNPMGAANWLDRFKQYFEGRDVVILQDNDEAGRERSPKVADSLQGTARRVRVLALPNLPEHGDVSDWLEAGGTVAQLRELVDQLPERELETPLPVLWFDQMQPVLQARDFVQGFLLESSSALLFGEPGVGKSFAATDLALHVAAGKRWHGRRVDQGGVVYCAMEGGAGLMNRVSAWREAHGMQRTWLPFVGVPQALNLRDHERDTPALIATIKMVRARMPVPVKLVVVDTFNRAIMGGNENAPDDMGAMIKAQDAIRAETGACVLFIHHPGKDASRGARGHTSLLGSLDTEIQLTKDADSGTVTATVTKQRDMRKGVAVSFRLEERVLGQNQHGEDVTTCVVAPADSPPSRPAKGKGRRGGLTDTDRSWSEQLQAMFLEPSAAQLRVPMDGMTSVLTLTRDQVREGFRVRGRFVANEPHAALTSADRKKFSDRLNSLVDKGEIAMGNNLVWLLVSQREPA